MARKSLEDVRAQLEAAESLVVVGGFYRHYKQGDIYQLLSLALQEFDNQICVVYQAQYGDTLRFTRPLVSWLEIVHTPDGPKQRFLLEE